MLKKRATQPGELPLFLRMPRLLNTRLHVFTLCTFVLVNVVWFNACGGFCNDKQAPRARANPLTKLEWVLRHARA